MGRRLPAAAAVAVLAALASCSGDDSTASSVTRPPATTNTTGAPTTSTTTTTSTTSPTTTTAPATTVAPASSITVTAAPAGWTPAALASADGLVPVLPAGDARLLASIATGDGAIEGNGRRWLIHTAGQIESVARAGTAVLLLTLDGATRSLFAVDTASGAVTPLPVLLGQSASIRQVGDRVVGWGTASSSPVVLIVTPLLRVSTVPLPEPAALPDGLVAVATGRLVLFGVDDGGAATDAERLHHAWQLDPATGTWAIVPEPVPIDGWPFGAPHEGDWEAAALTVDDPVSGQPRALLTYANPGGYTGLYDPVTSTWRTLRNPFTALPGVHLVADGTTVRAVSTWLGAPGGRLHAAQLDLRSGAWSDDPLPATATATATASATTTAPCSSAQPTVVTSATTSYLTCNGTVLAALDLGTGGSWRTARPPDDAAAHAAALGAVPAWSLT